MKTKVNFDKCLIAWGSAKKKIGNQYENMFYLEDRYSHAKIHNEILKAKNIVILGSTMEAYNYASQVRTYLDSVGQKSTNITVLPDGNNSMHRSLGDQVTDWVIREMREKQGI